MLSPRSHLSSLCSIALGLSLILLSACGGGGGDTTTQGTAATSGTGPATGIPSGTGTDATGTGFDPSLVEARALYASRCALCHGDKGQGFAADGANALASPEWLSIASDELIRSGIARGRVEEGTPMPAFGINHNGTLNDAQIDGLVRLIRSWETLPKVDLSTIAVPPGKAGRGEAVYQLENCGRCHGNRGQGATRTNGFMSINDPDFLAHASDAYLYRTLVDGRPGTVMPSYRHLDQQQLGDLVALIRSWQRPVNDEPIPKPDNDIENAVLNPAGAAPQFVLRDNKYVSVDQVNQQIFEENRKAVIFDAREPSDWIRHRIRGARNIPFYDAEAYLARIPKDTFIITYCGCPHAASGALADKLRASGFPNVAVLDEGFWIWDDKGYPTARGDEQ